VIFTIHFRGLTCLFEVCPRYVILEVCRPWQCCYQNAYHRCTDLDDTRKDAIALFDFRARNEKELSLKKGDTVQLHARVSSEWWRGSSSGQTGLVPHSYIAVQSRWAVVCYCLYCTNIDSHSICVLFIRGQKYSQKERSLRSTFSSSHHHTAELSEKLLGIDLWVLPRIFWVGGDYSPRLSNIRMPFLFLLSRILVFWLKTTREAYYLVFNIKYVHQSLTWPILCQFSVTVLICTISILLDYTTVYIGWSDVTESMVTIRSPFCGYNTT